jgi:hypothetical protein
MAINKVLKRGVKFVGRNCRDALLLCGLGPRLNEDNRRVLEGRIFPHLLADASLQRFVFVGVHWYTWHYNRIFKDREFRTIDIDPARRRYGAAGHIVDSAARLPEYFASGTVDCIMMIGVIGWGVDTRDLAEEILRGFHHCLRSDGLLILGCDETPRYMPFAYAELLEPAGFQPITFPPLGAHRHRCEGDFHHTYSFYSPGKPQAARAPITLPK